MPFSLSSFVRWLALLVVLSACGKTEMVVSTSDSHSTARTIKNGTSITASTYPHVGAVLTDFGNAGQGICTGTLIAPTLVLTAAHCVFAPSGNTLNRAAQTFFTRVSDVYNTQLNTSNTTRVINIIAPYGFDEVFYGLPARNDFVLLRLESAIDLPDYPKIGSQGNLQTGQQLEVVGYGQNEKNIAGVRRSGTMSFSGWSRLSGGNGSDTFLELASATSSQSTCPGDSGGPAFLRNSDGTLSLVGISHVGPNKACANVSQVTHTAIDAYLSFIQDILSSTGRTRFTNANNRYDVNDDGYVSAIDALLIINELNRTSNPTALVGGPFLDVTGDGSVAPNDALWVINYMNSQGPSAAYAFKAGSSLILSAGSRVSYTSKDVDSVLSSQDWKPALQRTKPLARSLDYSYAFSRWENSNLGDQRLIYGRSGQRFLLSRSGSLKRIVRTFAGRDVAVPVAELIPAYYDNPNLIVKAY